MVGTPIFTLDELTGRTRGHLSELTDPVCVLHKRVVSPFLTLRAAASADGIDLVAVSSFRDFDRQVSIWNGKFRGERPVQDKTGRPLDVSALSPAERVEAILWWSALPGTSRHHWGTDFDVVDGASIPPGYKVQLVPAEYGEGGPFHRLATWLSRHMHAFGFYRPFATDRGGTSPEPWHLSYAPVAAVAEGQLSLEGLRKVLETSDIEGKAEVLHALARNFETYVVNVDPPPGPAMAAPVLA
jgi:LAS superfamily LD-carboxypeptidase LdcB